MEETLKNLTIGQLLDQSAARFPDSDAVVYVDRDLRMTYRQLGEVVDRLDRGLMALGVMDADGYLSITGRHKDMIIRGGENIYPREIEEFLYGIEGIVDVQVAGVPSKKYGEEVGAFVIKKAGSDLTPEDIRDYCRGKISRFKIPKHVAFVDSYPMTASGKVQKYKLQELSVSLFPGEDRIGA